VKPTLPTPWDSPTHECHEGRPHRRYEEPDLSSSNDEIMIS